MAAADPIVIVESNPDWPVQFDAIAQEISIALEPAGGLVTIEHVGSTSVPDLPAKPIIDLLIGVDALATVNAKWIEPLADLGYVYVPKFEDTLPMRRYFDRHRGEPKHRRSVHLHIVEPTSDFWREHLLFRDYLRSHQEAMRAYGDLKKKLAVTHRHDRNDYTDAKSDFILAIVERAKIESIQ